MRNHSHPHYGGSVKMRPDVCRPSQECVGAGTKGEWREFKRRKVFWLWELSLGRGVEEAGAGGGGGGGARATPPPAPPRPPRHNADAILNHEKNNWPNV